MRLQPRLEQSMYSFMGPFLHVSTGFLLSISHLHSSWGFFSFFFPYLLWYEEELQNRNTASINPFFSVLGVRIMFDLSTSSAFSSPLAFRNTWFLAMCLPSTILWQAKINANVNYPGFCSGDWTTSVLGNKEYFPSCKWKNKAYIFKVKAVTVPGMVGLYWAEWREGPFFSDNEVPDTPGTNPRFLSLSTTSLVLVMTFHWCKPSNFYYYVARVW